MSDDLTRAEVSRVKQSNGGYIILHPLKSHSPNTYTPLKFDRNHNYNFDGFNRH